MDPEFCDVLETGVASSPSRIFQSWSATLGRPRTQDNSDERNEN
nr:MAG TPA: hypothetical protein [Caudoviricetes sp.]DAY42528.1 MAG TPA: hypothetical protein [Caudoviricetes sp.]